MIARSLVVKCNHCRRVVMMPGEIGDQELERLRLHLRLHSLSPFHDPITDGNEVLRHFTVYPRLRKRRPS